jgi:type I restriction enzyme S subunit
MNRYQSYKPSGVKWIGEIPEYWEVRRIKFLFKSIVEKSIDGSEELLSVSEKRGIVPRKELRDENEELTRSESLEGYLKVEVDDLVNNIMLMWKRGLGFSNYNGIVSPSYSVFRLNKPNIPSYWNYLLRTDLYITEYKRNSTGVIDSRLRLYDDSFGDIYSILPPLNEQIEIVQYLDEKTELIDKLISTKERKITILKQQRISLINQVVTKGLNPNVKMKDSGVEWIGEIPEGWGIIPLKVLGGFQNGISKGSEFFGHGLPFMNYGDVYKNHVTPLDVEGKVDSTDSERNQYSVLRGDIFFTRTSESKDDIGVSSTCLKSINQCVFSGFVIRFRFYQETHVPEYSKYHFQTHWKKVFIESKMNIVTRSSLSQQVLGQVPVLIPPIEEQNQIVEHLDSKTKQIDDLVQLEQKKIDLLKDYRQSLISEVVTGKIKVTN